MLTSILIGIGIFIGGKVLAGICAIIAKIFLSTGDDDPTKPKWVNFIGYFLILLSLLSFIGAWVGLIYYILQALKL